MHKQIKFRLASNQGAEFKISDVAELELSDIGAVSAFIKDGEDLIGYQIDGMMNFLQEFTTKFDKQGLALYTGDVVKHNEDFFSIAFIDGAFAGVCEKKELVFPLTEMIARMVEKVGNIYQNPSFVEVEPTQEELEEKINNQNA